MKNVTVDGTASTKEIAFTPATCNGTDGWRVVNDRGHGGSYTWCGNPDVKATFTFTGIGVYYLCPTIANHTVQFTLDGVPGGSANLGATNDGNPSISPVVWSQTGLPYGQHVLEVLPGNTTRVFIDAFIYTTLDQEELSSMSTTPTSTTTAPKTTAVAQIAQPETVKNRVPIIVGSIIGFFILAIFIGITYRLWKTRKRGNIDDFGASTGTGMIRSPTPVHANSVPLSGERSPNSTTPIRPLPSTFGATANAKHHRGDSGGESDDEISDLQHYQYRGNTATASSHNSRSHLAPQSRPTYPPALARSDTTNSTTMRLEPVRRHR
ncbi:hypothetical protein DFP72DRAFT_1165367 [Ephemerocybe angulata]|uniref:Uncharacterized protein n=1 Tax=Ephemerocybe angulata TaxID=980116 RepID=A0A8H6IA14_9AGAR|nr:hypothetical protein DFP72DRAFT_1165367 [Tulosesus angulatus]